MKIIIFNSEIAAQKERIFLKIILKNKTNLNSLSVWDQQIRPMNTHKSKKKKKL